MTLPPVPTDSTDHLAYVLYGVAANGDTWSLNAIWQTSTMSATPAPTRPLIETASSTPMQTASSTSSASKPPSHSLTAVGTSTPSATHTHGVSPTVTPSAIMTSTATATPAPTSSGVWLLSYALPGGEVVPLNTRVDDSLHRIIINHIDDSYTRIYVDGDLQYNFDKSYSGNVMAGAMLSSLGGAIVGNGATVGSGVSLASFMLFKHSLDVVEVADLLFLQSIDKLLTPCAAGLALYGGTVCTPPIAYHFDAADATVDSSGKLSWPDSAGNANMFALGSLSATVVTRQGLPAVSFEGGAKMQATHFAPILGGEYGSFFWLYVGTLPTVDSEYLFTLMVPDAADDDTWVGIGLVARAGCGGRIYLEWDGGGGGMGERLAFPSLPANTTLVIGVNHAIAVFGVQQFLHTEVYVNGEWRAAARVAVTTHDY